MSQAIDLVLDRDSSQVLGPFRLLDVNGTAQSLAGFGARIEFYATNGALIAQYDRFSAVKFANDQYSFTVNLAAWQLGQLGLNLGSYAIFLDPTGQQSISSYLHISGKATLKVPVTFLPTYDNPIIVGPTGLTGADGQPFNYRGNYSGGTAYVTKDVVTDNGALYIALQNTVGNGTGNGAYWQLLVSGGFPVSGTQYAVGIEDPGGTWLVRRLRQSDILPDFAALTFAKTAPNGASVLYRRGDTLTGVTATATYTQGPPTAASIANSYGGSTDGGDVDPGVWTINSPFASASLAGSIKRSGSNAGADPTWTSTLSADGAGVVGSQKAITVTWTSDVYYGSTSNASPGQTEVLAASSSLQTGRTGTFALTLAGTYALFAIPATYGSPTFKDATTGFQFDMTSIGTVSVTRNGVTRDYNVWRGTNLLSGSYNLAVT